MAVLLLRLGGYGLLRVFPVLFKFGFRFGVVWVALNLVRGLFVSLFYIRQTDLKPSVAYSSVAHMSMVIALMSSEKIFKIIPFSIHCIRKYYGPCFSPLFQSTVVTVLTSAFSFAFPYYSYQKDERDLITN